MTNLNNLSLGAPLVYGTTPVVEELKAEDKVKILEQKVYELTNIINKFKNDHIISNTKGTPVGVIHERGNDFFVGTPYASISEACKSMDLGN